MTGMLINPYRFAAAGGGGAGYSAAVLADSPWGYWRLTETSGALQDETANNRDMTVTGTATYNQAGPVDKALKFPGSTTGYAGAVTLGTSPVTIEMWVYLAGLNSVNLFGFADGYGGSTADKSLFTVNGVVHFRTYPYSTLTTGAWTLPTGQWNHVVASVGAAGQKIRVNGVQRASAAGATGSYNGAMNPFLRGAGGADHQANTADVVVAEVALWASQLSDAQTDAHYAAA